MWLTVIITKGFKHEPNVLVRKYLRERKLVIECYDNQIDLHQNHNVAAKYPHVAKELVVVWKN